MISLHWYEAVLIGVGLVGTFLLCVGVKVAFDSLNDLVYGEETMNLVLEREAKDGY